MKKSSNEGYFSKAVENFSTAGLSSLGVPGVPWQTQILADQLTLHAVSDYSDQRWAFKFLKNYQFLDADRFLILQAWALAVS